MDHPYTGGDQRGVSQLLELLLAIRATFPANFEGRGHLLEILDIFSKALPVFRAVGIGWFAVNCFSVVTYGGRLAILFAGRKSLRSSDLR